MIKDTLLEIDTDGSFEIILVVVFDNDLEKSEQMKKRAENRGCKVIQLDPNMEGYLMNLLGCDVGKNLKTEDFRNDCKSKFYKHFQKKAHDLKDSDFKAIFTDKNKNDKTYKELEAIFL